VELWHDYTFIRLFFLAARRMNPEGLPFFINPSVLADTSPIFCCAKHPVRLRGTARAEFRSSSLFICDFSNSTPSPFGHSPYIPLRKHRGRGGLTLLFPLQAFLTPLLVATLLISPIFFAPHTAMLRGTAGEEGEGNPPLIAVRYFVYGVRQGRIVIQRTFFPSQRKSLLH